MSRFYASIQGSRGEATRMGTKNSGIRGHVRGWSVGATVDGSADMGADVITIHGTAGSNGGESPGYLVQLSDESGEARIIGVGEAVREWLREEERQA